MRQTGQLAAEFVGTMILILFGVGVVAQVVTAGNEDFGNHNSIVWAWGMGVTFGIFAAGRISGAHLNPAVTLALAAFRGFPWKQVIPFIVAQTAGAFVAALLVRWNYGSVLSAVDPGHTIATQGVFSTLPGNGALDVSLWGGLRDQIIGTAILLFLIFAITDRRNIRMPESLSPFAIGAVVVGLGMAWGSIAGYAINPARDFGPRLASYLTGFDTAFLDQHGAQYWWVPIVGPLVGGLLGAALYRYLVEAFLYADDPETQSPSHTEEFANG
ncbi:MIP/aquaporin family protein [Mycobacteriaceae bacterium NPDC060252]